MKTVAKKRKAVTKAALNNLFLLITRFLNLVNDEVNSIIIKRLIALITNNKLMSDKYNGGSCIL